MRLHRVSTERVSPERVQRETTGGVGFKRLQNDHVNV